MTKWIRQGSKLPMEGKVPEQNMSTKKKTQAQSRASGTVGKPPKATTDVDSVNYQGRVK